MKVRFVVHMVLAACFSSLSHAETIFPAVDCVIIPSKTVDISAAVPGVIKTLFVERSEEVHKGQLLSELDSRVEQANVELSRVRSKMSAEISAEEVNLKYDKLQSRRVNNLKQKNLTSAQNKDEAARLEKVTYWRLKQAKDTLKTRQLELARAIAQLEETKVYSTLDGVVAQVYKAEGEYIEDQPIMRLVQLNPLHVEAVLPMEHYGSVQKRMIGGVFSEVDPNNELQANVIIIDPVGDTASGTFGVRLTMDNPENKIPAGMKCVLKLKSNMLNADEALQSTPKNGASASDQKVDLTNAFSFGPFDNESAAFRTEQMLRNKGYAFERRDESVSQVKGYLVLLANDYQKSAHQLMSEFKRSDVSGMMLLPRRSYDGRLSFGAYDGAKMAALRQQNLSEKGIRSEVVSRYSDKPRIWLDVTDITEQHKMAVLKKIREI
ncbi:efflux RND transporter periplasmic adaptor subunit [Neptunomonas sp.]|uniref:efflux RND transporter periplasmic adaptor subunit n=1 Tax=Neptunomonas sp. TaxID=1971898 RepID=UPI0025F7D48D|nr:efflux RND transporter periplasmic adaptor subunit [Neptunomonas sp.]